MTNYTTAVLTLINNAITSAIPSPGDFVIEECSGLPVAVRSLGDGTVLVATNKTYRSIWTTEDEPTLRLTLFHADAWTHGERPFASAVTTAVTSPAAIATALDSLDVSMPHWLTRWHRNNMSILAETYRAEIEGLARLGITAAADDSSRGCFVLAVDLPRGTRLLISDADEDDPFLPLTATTEGRTGWRLDHCSATGEPLDLHGQPMPWSATPNVTTDLTPAGLMELAIASGYAPSADRPPLDPRFTTLTIADVAAAVIAELADLPDLESFTVFDQLQSVVDANMLGGTAVAAYEKQSGRPWTDFAPDYQRLVSRWLTARHA